MEIDRISKQVEVFWMGADEFDPDDQDSWMGERVRDLMDEGMDLDQAREDLEGWYYWYCFPGCLPEGEADGPHETEYHAWEHLLGGEECDCDDCFEGDRYEVHAGNIGMVYRGNCEVTAHHEAAVYAGYAATNYGRTEWPVVIFEDGEILREYDER